LIIFFQFKLLDTQKQSLSRCHFVWLAFQLEFRFCIWFGCSKLVVMKFLSWKSLIFVWLAQYLELGMVVVVEVERKSYFIGHKILGHNQHSNYFALVGKLAFFEHWSFRFFFPLLTVSFCWILVLNFVAWVLSICSVKFLLVKFYHPNFN